MSVTTNFYNQNKEKEKFEDLKDFGSTGGGITSRVAPVRNIRHPKLFLLFSASRAA